MNIVIVGTGYVGLVTGTCLAEVGNNVICVDIDEKKIENLRKGIITIYEPNLETMVLKNVKSGNLTFTTRLEDAITNSNICFIAVGTPMGEDGSADLQYVLQVAKDIAIHMNQHTYIINKSTVPVGTAEKTRATVQKVLNEKKSKVTFDVISNPEFLKEGCAVNDFLKPDRIVVGVDNNNAKAMMERLYSPFIIDHNEKLIIMDIKSSEMTKYAANAMLATKISFINEISNICELLGADINKVRHGIGSDKRIGYSFIYPGCGYGGSCFPKDVQALIKTAKDYNYKPEILQSVETVNHNQKKILVNKIVKRFGEDLSDKLFAVWGLAFKPETDDMREASSITIINELTSKGAKIRAYDPKAVKEAKEYYLKDNISIEYTSTKYDTLKSADALILVTEWNEFLNPDFNEIKKLMKNTIIFDGRNQYNKETMNKLNIEYYQIGVK